MLEISGINVECVTKDMKQHLHQAKGLGIVKIVILM